jgi:hypothetical protein
MNMTGVSLRHRDRRGAINMAKMMPDLLNDVEINQAVDVVADSFRGLTTGVSLRHRDTFRPPPS